MKSENGRALAINIQYVMRRLVLEPHTRQDSVDLVDTYYSVYGLNSQLDEILARTQNGFHWLHYGDYASFAEAVIGSRVLYSYRIIKCELFYDGTGFTGIKGTHI